MTSGKTILAVDDDPGARHLLRFVLAKTGCRILLAADGDEALALASRETIHLLVTDLMMAGMDGFQLAQLLSQLPAYAHLPVIVLSARWQADLPAAKADARIILIAKPFSPLELTAQVRLLLEL